MPPICGLSSALPENCDESDAVWRSKNVARRNDHEDRSLQRATKLSACALKELGAADANGQPSREHRDATMGFQ